jgi:hypothetical protein
MTIGNVEVAECDLPLTRETLPFTPEHNRFQNVQRSDAA